MNLQLQYSSSSIQGPRERNEDSVGFIVPDSDLLNSKGACFAIADGVSGSSDGLFASKNIIKSLSNDFYSTPVSWTIQESLNKVITSINLWIYNQSQTEKYKSSLASTLSTLIIRGCSYFIAHIGDTRVYLIRNKKIKKLTRDHVWNGRDMRHILSKAIGLDKTISIDFYEGKIKKGDVFIIVSDGVWGHLSDLKIETFFQNLKKNKSFAEVLTEEAVKHKTKDNASALVINVKEVGDDSIGNLQSLQNHLPVPKKLNKGDLIDSFKVVEKIHDSRKTILYKVQNKKKQLFVLKTLAPTLNKSVDDKKSLINEEWILKRLISEHFPQIFSGHINKTYLYYLMTWHQGVSLDQRIKNDHHFSINGVVNIADKVANAISILHRLNIIHRDIKPENIFYGDDHKIRILDFGVAKNSQIDDIPSMANPGTPSFMAPELFDNNEADEQADIYALGVTLYYLLTRKYPYGEIEAFQSPKFGNVIPPSKYRRDIPIWFNNFILKAVEKNKSDRFETIEEMIIVLELRDKNTIQIRNKPLLEKTESSSIKNLFFVISILLNIFLLYFYLIT